MTQRFCTSPSSSVVHLADIDLNPMCGCTNAAKDMARQQDIGPATCWRCLKLEKTLAAADSEARSALECASPLALSTPTPITSTNGLCDPQHREESQSVTATRPDQAKRSAHPSMINDGGQAGSEGVSGNAGAVDRRATEASC